MVKQFFSTSIAKATIDILLIAGLLFSSSSAEHSADSWGSFHCIASMTWYGLILVHIGQHWSLTKAMFKRKVMKRNKITFLTVFVFICLTISIFIFIAGVNHQSMHIHHAIAKLFGIVIIIHAIQKRKRFVSLFKNKKPQQVKQCITWKTEYPLN